ncbi:putative DEAD/DEAH box RNA helicase [Aulographum hederae CBS 113979]|uniref:RNA helicase n=1 Tax=Aulographum hederae CBS 113979 TaxID=1176131 RepID=A0A6G1HH13_9PEZI|nr:putative DEAD/DEAH box RNA helicase [Aulographum hederae CBS 113979]
MADEWNTPNPDAFETSAMVEAVDEITNEVAEGSQASEVVPYEPHPNTLLTKEELAAKARDSGWVVPQPYNYDVYTSDNKDDGEWGASSAKYEWNDDYGEVGPKIPELEAQLFKGEYTMRIGEHLENIKKFKVFVEGPVNLVPIASFEDAGLHPAMLENVNLCQYEFPTPIQAYIIPTLLLGFDVVACAQTGSGKTAAYLIPILSKLMGKAKKLAARRAPRGLGEPVRGEPLVLVVVPTRELAVQIFDEARRLCYRTMLRPCVAYGGAPVGIQADEIKKGCDILIATPGRLIDFMNRPTLLSMNRVKFTVIDEADELLTPDWETELHQIMMGGDSNEDADHIYMLFSATFPKEARKIAKKYLAEDHVRIRVGRAGSTHENIKQELVFVTQSQKNEALYDLLFAVPPARTLIFVNSKKQADLLDDFLYNRDLPSTSIHSDRTQREREDALRAFRHGDCPIMVATGVSARGMDIKNVKHVINYDLPDSDHGGIDEYIHRIGRTARIGNDGLSTSFFNERNEDIAEKLVKVLIESKMEVPDFLQQYMPENPDDINWDDNSQDDPSDDEAKDEWGAGDGEGAADANGVDDSWGAPAQTDATVGADEAWNPDI